MKFQDYTNRYLPDDHYRREPPPEESEPDEVFGEDAEYERRRDDNV